MTEPVLADARDMLTALLGEVGFMRSCIASGEKLTPQDLERQDAVMARVTHSLATAQRLDTMDAWGEAETALPVPGRIACQKRPENGPYEAWAQSDERKGLGYAYGASPTEALRSLAAYLSEAPGE